MHINRVHYAFEITNNKGKSWQDISPNEGKHLEKIQPHHQNKVRIPDFHRFIHEC